MSFLKWNTMQERKRKTDGERKEGQERCEKSTSSTNGMKRVPKESRSVEKKFRKQIDFICKCSPKRKKNCTADTNSDSTKVLFHRCWLYVWVSAYLGCSGTYDRFHNDYSLSWRLMAIAVRVNACVSWPMHIFDFYRCDYFPFVCYASSFNSLRLFFCSILTTTDVKVLLTHKCHHFISRPS